MISPSLRVGAVGAVVIAAACGSATSPPARPAPSPAPTPAATPAPDTAPKHSAATLQAAARADSVRRHYTPADVAFMTHMIHHHAQALVMARMAPTHGADEQIRTLAERIINGQRDEIFLMQRWLRERGEPVPEAGHAGAGASMAGMLTPEQMERLRSARGAEWDRLFLKYMIQHHQGALVMVDALFAAHGAGQADDVFRIASGIAADQATEIDRMQRMLQARVFGGPR